MSDFANNPGLLFVVGHAAAAGLVRLLLLLVGGLRTCVPAATATRGWGESLYQLFGGDRPGTRRRLRRHRRPSAWPSSCSVDRLRPASLGARRSCRHHARTSRPCGRHAGRPAHGRRSTRPRRRSTQLDEHERRWSGQSPGRIDCRLPSTARRRPEPARCSSSATTSITSAAIMFVMVTFIATLIHLFSIGYMGDELERDGRGPPGPHRATATCTAAAASAGSSCSCRCSASRCSTWCWPTTSSRCSSSWELVGICSYLLIGFYYERQSASNAANKAFITNRVGDAGFIIGLLILWTYVGTLQLPGHLQPGPLAADDADATASRPAGAARSSAATGDEQPDKAGSALRRSSADGRVARSVLFPRELGEALPRRRRPRRRRSTRRRRCRTAERRRPVRHDALLAAGRRRAGHLPRLRRQVGPVPAARLAARRDGRPDARSAP